LAGRFSRFVFLDNAIRKKERNVFQESLVGSGAAARKTWSFAVSFLAQTMAICLTLLATMAYTPLLPAAGFAVWLEAPPPPPGAPPPPPEQVVVVRQPDRYEDRFVQPREIPAEIAMIVDVEEAPPRVDQAHEIGVIGSGGPSIPDDVISSIATSVLKPVERPKPQPKAEEPPTAPAGPIRVSSTIQAARMIRRVQPDYPVIAKQAGISGKVRLKAIISTDGSVEQLSVLGGHPFLIPAAVAAVKQWRYRPTLLNGKAVQVATDIEVNFILN